jgi:hypothetical protein
MLEQVKAFCGSDPQLQLLHMGIFELDDLPALGAYHVIVMLAQVQMLISGLTVIKTIFLRKTISAHQFDGFRHKFGRQPMTALIDQIGQIAGSHMVLCSEKDLKNGQAIMKAIDSVLFEQLYKLSFFLLVD